MARFIALVYNWWNLFVRLAEPNRHLEAITNRPLLLSAIAERTRHARQTTLTVASSHAQAEWAAIMLSGIARFLRELTQNAEQLTADQRWHRILAHAVRGFLNGPDLGSKDAYHKDVGSPASAKWRAGPSLTEIFRRPISPTLAHRQGSAR